MRQIDGQMSIFDISKPDYHGAMDEITRYSIEVDFERSIKLHKCLCGHSPKQYFKGAYEQFVKCEHCEKRTKYYRHAYEAMQAWNRGEYDDQTVSLYIFGKEWNPLSVKPEGITEYDDLEILGPYKSVYGERYSCCPAKLHEGQIVAYNVPWDIPRPDWKYWRLKEKVFPVDIMGLCDDAYCPKCGRELDDLRIKDCERCPDCHVRIDWTPWHRANDTEEEI